MFSRTFFFVFILILILGGMFMNRAQTAETMDLPEAPVLKWTDDPAELGLDEGLLEKAFKALERGAKMGKVPGSVAVIGRNGVALKPRAFGNAVLEPKKIPMAPDTVFDLASLTKMIATNTSIMILQERGKIDLDDPVVKYIPEFAAKGKETVTIRQLLTHTSGFPPFVRYYRDLEGREAFFKVVCNQELKTRPGEKRAYSDIGFKTLGFIVEKVSGKDLNSFAGENIFKPLGMKHTRFNPPASWREKCAATEKWPLYKDHKLAWGEVHDENANAMGGIAGHAGLFSTAGDLAVFCEMITNGGKYGDAPILSPKTVRQFHTPQLDPEISSHQAMGWNLGREKVGSTGGLGPGSFGHTGFTGTSIWIHPKYGTYAILLTNAIHPDREKAERAFVRVPFYKAVREAMEKATASPESLSRLFPVDHYWVEKTLGEMTLEEKAGQLIVPTYLNKEEKGLELIEEIAPGGVIAYPRNPARPLARLMNRFQRASRVPLLVTADFERGVGCYIDGATDLPSNMALGAAGSPSVAAEAARITALESRAIGVQLDFAPVLDVNNNPLNPIINIRSFGEDPGDVARKGVAWIKSAQKHGLLCTGKHFPGHGNTHIDSHSSLGKIAGELEALHEVELYPFRLAIEKADVSSIMTAHLWLPAFEKKPVPATLSKKIMTGLLRDEFGFEGILFTDAMVMKGITKEISFGESVIRSVEAGCDVILMPGDPVRARDAIVEAARSGRIPEKRLDKSVRRILEAKTRVNLHKERFVDLERIEAYVGTVENFETAKDLARKTLTLVQSAPGVLPLSREKSTAVILLSNQIGKIMVWRDIYSFGDEVKKLNPQTRVLFMGDDVDEKEKKQSLEMLEECDQVIIALYPRIVIGRGNVALNLEQKSFLDDLVDARIPHVTISFGSPYVLAELKESPTYICTYGNARAVQAAAAEALFEEKKLSGRLPVSISKPTGETIPADR